MSRMYQVTNLADAADEVLRLLGHNRPPLDEAAE
jgi:methylmalonyl-CoA mutase